MLKNTKLGKKLIITYIFITLISSIGGIIGLSVMKNMDANYSSALTNYGFSQGDIGLFSSEFNSNYSTVNNIIMIKDIETVSSNSQKLEASNTKLEDYIAKMQKTMTTQKELDKFNTIKNDFTKYEEATKQIVSSAQQSNDSQLSSLMDGQITPMANEISTSITDLLDLKTEAGSQTAASLSSQGNIASAGILAIILIALVVSVLIALYIARGISKPVRELAQAAQKMSEGDLSAEVSVNSSDEIGQLSAAFTNTIATLKAYITDIKISLAQMAQGDLNVTLSKDFKGDFKELKNSINGIVTSLNNTLSQIHHASEQVSFSSSQVSDGAQELAQGATEQASSVEELTATIEEISSHIKDNAAHAIDVSKNVTHVSEEIEASNQHMNEMMTAMTHISESSGEIGKIIKTIEDIAFQTNILALNAAVEAARAGEAGKGFAVVADEVRNLASKSATAAKDTTELIENSMRQVEDGTKIADETANSLFQVVESAKVVASIVEKISQVTIQQSKAINQVVTGIEQISGVVQTNSATAEESAAASEELSGQAQVLETLVRQFKLKSQEGTTVQSDPTAEPDATMQAESAAQTKWSETGIESGKY